MKKLALVLVGAVTVSIAAVTRQFRRNDNAAGARLDAIPRRVIDTDPGELEYAEVGDGEPVLAIHGIFGGCDANGLLVPHDGRGDPSSLPGCGADLAAERRTSTCAQVG